MSPGESGDWRRVDGTISRRRLHSSIVIEPLPELTSASLEEGLSSFIYCSLKETVFLKPLLIQLYRVRKPTA